MTPWFDLTAALPELEASGQYAAVCATLRKLWSLYAVKADLDAARASIEQLMKMGPHKGARAHTSQGEIIVADALLMNAVVSYCRAAHSEAVDGRLPMLGLKHFNSEERAQHDLVVHLRNKAIAHHGYGDAHPEMPWLRDAVTVRIAPKVLSIRGPYVRLNTSKATMTALEALTRRALQRVDELEPPMREALGHAFMEASEDPNFRSIVGGVKFDGAAFFGDLPGWDAGSSDFALKPGEKAFWMQG